MNQLISIIVPVYNVEHYLDRCLKSILEQTYKNIEIVIVDDGSTDSSGIICDKYLTIDNRIKVFHKKNGGLSDARNYGIKKSNGEYLMFVDSDDYIPSNAIEILFNLITEKKADVSIGKIKTGTSSNIENNNNMPNIETFDNRQAIKEMLYANKFSTSASGKLFKRELFKNVEFPLHKLYEDFHTIYKILDKSKLIVFENEIVYYYIIRKGSITHSDFSIKSMDNLDALKQIKSEIDINKYGLEKAFASKTLESVFGLFQYNIDIKIATKYKLWQLVKENRKIVLADDNATKRVKGYAIISFFGFYISQYVYKFYYKIKYLKN